MLSLLVYVAFLLVGTFTFKQRCTACQRLIVITAIGALVLGAIDNTRMPFYLILTAPILIVAAAAVYEDFRQRIPSYMAGIVACLLLLSPINVLRLAIRDHEEDLYGKTIEFIKTNAGPKQLVMGSSELFFGLGADRLIDDIWLGYYSGLEPQVIVVGPPADGRDVLAAPTDRINREAAQHVRTLREHKFYAAYSNRVYTVYLARSAQ